MAQTAFIVHVPEAELCVQAFRERFDPSARRGVPAHITILAPFMSPEHVTQKVLEQAQLALSEVPAFSFSLSKVGRFPTTTYLAPEPDTSFIELTRSLVRKFPQFPPCGGEFDSIIPHLTVAHGRATEAENVAVELVAGMKVHGPIISHCASVLLLENSSGIWQQMHTFALPRPSAETSKVRTNT
jgi:2'-5' RNA ligase